MFQNQIVGRSIIPAGSQRENLFACISSFQRLPIFLGSQKLPPSLQLAARHLQISALTLCCLCHISYSDSPASYKDPCNYTGLTVVIQDNLSSRNFNLNHISSSFLSCKWIYSHVLGLRCGHLGIHYSVYITLSDY